jgi:PAS domain S-box-containing protein
VEHSPSKVSRSWLDFIKLAVATGLAYFLAGQLGLVLRAEPGVAVFWPASGIAVGALIALGPSVRLPVAAGVLVATAACNLMIGRDARLSIAFGLLNAGQTLFTVWLLERWFERTFRLEDVQRVLGFIAATAIGSAIAALGAVVAISLVEPTAFPLHVWRIWFAACSLGIVTVAPLLIALSDVMRERLPRHELIEGWAGLVMLTALIAFLISLPDEPWETALEALVFASLLWLAMRCRPVFAAAAALVVGLIVIGSTILNIGYFESDMPLADRILSAQIFVMAAAILVVVLAAVFADRRKAELALAERNAQLALARKVALVGGYAYDVTTERMQVAEGYAAIHGLPEGTTETTRSEWRARVHPEDVEWLEGHRSQTFRNRRRDYNVEYRIVPSGREVRWIESRGFISYRPDGHPQRVTGVNIDVTERKRTEGLLNESKARLADALAAGQVMAFEWDAATGVTQRSDNASLILGDEQGEVASPRRNNFLGRVHADDRERFRTHIRQLSARNSSYALTFRFVRPDGETVWLEETAKGEFDAVGRLLRIKGLTRDITDRKRVEEQRRILLGELDHRVKNTLATVSAVMSHTLNASSSMADFATALDGRIQSMARTHDLLSASRWQGISVAELIRRELAPYATTDNTEINGPEVLLRAEAGQVMAMVLHELATNAAKYGALSTQYGRVSIRWRQRPNGRTRSHLVLEWLEVGGPSAVASENSGFGTHTIRDLIPYELGGTVDLSIAPKGVRCRIEIPADWLSNDGEPLSSIVHPGGLARS